MELKEFQLNAVKKLFEAMETPARDIILKSPTGSGKTIILTYFMHQYIQSFPKTVFVWLTPGKGNLEEQSKAKMDKYIHASQTKLLSDVMTAGFEENDSCFINWEKLTKKGNNALKDSERTNFLEHIEHALNDGLRFIIIVDESHQNNTIKADEIIQYFRTEKIIRCSATPKGIAKAEVIEIPEEEVIAAGLIKKMLVINQDFPQTVETEDQTAYLLERALQKQRELRAAYLQMDVDINPLIIVQIPNKSETLLDGVERWFEAQGLTYENGQLAVWLSDRHEIWRALMHLPHPLQLLSSSRPWPPAGIVQERRYSSNCVTIWMRPLKSRPLAVFVVCRRQSIMAVTCWIAAISIHLTRSLLLASRWRWTRGHSMPVHCFSRVSTRT